MPVVLPEGERLMAHVFACVGEDGRGDVGHAFIVSLQPLMPVVVEELVPGWPLERAHDQHADEKRRDCDTCRELPRVAHQGFIVYVNRET